MEKIKLSMKDIFQEAVRREAKVAIQYADYALNEWTAPTKLTSDKVNMLINDGSIRKIYLELEM
jgi:hypothetical protein